MIEIDRVRRTELLYTPKSGIISLMKENLLSPHDIIFLASTKKITSSDIRLHAPVLCDRMISNILKQAIADYQNDDQKRKEIDKEIRTLAV